ncbi:hypothetical protein LTR56_019213 [Elasticomyces elasticus]|nr:hypothetical protein LTR56_019213 [Elasticomyces elasticus]KAK3633221.1 hypothetical protein LTR22_020221 [Elasticomyces elasticus]KAK4910620.1 hypothetical protein LTR49_020752 [Elasticomyces elasticus]KAK5751031.1 hypothetical protein LTS12_018932 [Elasticomyces elasticus]
MADQPTDEQRSRLAEAERTITELRAQLAKQTLEPEVPKVKELETVSQVMEVYAEEAEGLAKTIQYVPGYTIEASVSSRWDDITKKYQDLMKTLPKDLEVPALILDKTLDDQLDRMVETHRHVIKLGRARQILRSGHENRETFDLNYLLDEAGYWKRTYDSGNEARMETAYTSFLDKLSALLAETAA